MSFDFRLKKIFQFVAVIGFLLCMETVGVISGLYDLNVWGAIMILTLFCALPVFLVVERKMFPVSVVIFEALAGGGHVLWGKDAGVVLKNPDKQTDYFWLKKHKKDIPTPPLSCFMRDSKGGDTVYYVKYDRDTFKPLVIGEKSDPVFQSLDQDDKSFFVRQLALASQFKKKSVWETVLPYMGVLTFGIILFLILALFIQQIVPAMGEIAGALKDSANRLSSAMETFYGTVVPDSPTLLPVNQTFEYGERP